MMRWKGVGGREWGKKGQRGKRGRRARN